MRNIFSNYVCFSKSPNFTKMIPFFDSLPLIQNSNSIISFGYVDSYAKIFLILYPSHENFTTRIDIMSPKSTTEVTLTYEMHRLYHIVTQFSTPLYCHIGILFEIALVISCLCNFVIFCSIVVSTLFKNKLQWKFYFPGLQPLFYAHTYIMGKI